jgi:hypothetical protein
MRLVAALLLLAALNASVFAQDGARDAATAQDAAQALQLYLERTATSGGRPDYAKPPAADLFRHVFDLSALEALPPPQADNLPWLIAWGAAVDCSYKGILLFGLPLDQSLDAAAIRRNMADYEDQYAAALNFMVRFQARLAETTILILDALPASERTAPRAAGLQQTRVGATQSIHGALTAIGRIEKPANARLVSGALRDTRALWAKYIMPGDRADLIALMAKLPKATDEAVRSNLAAFAGALAAAP